MEFTLENYPKACAAIDRMRLEEYLHLPINEQEAIFHDLERFCIDRANSTLRRRKFHGYSFIAAGWEWSVFRKDEDTVIKIPAGIFPDVETPEYLANVEHLYALLGEHYPATMLAPTIFRRQNGMNTMEQQYIDSSEGVIIPWDLAHRRLARLVEKAAGRHPILLNNNDRP